MNIRIWSNNETAGDVVSSTDATPIQITTAAAHGYTDGDIVTIFGHVINLAANGTWVITVVDTTHFTLNDSTPSGVGAGASGTHQRLNPWTFPAQPGYTFTDDLVEVVNHLQIPHLVDVRGGLEPAITRATFHQPLGYFYLEQKGTGLLLADEFKRRWRNKLTLLIFIEDDSLYVRGRLKALPDQLQSGGSFWLAPNSEDCPFILTVLEHGTYSNWNDPAAITETER